MKRPELVLLGVVLAVAGFVGVEVHRAPRLPPAQEVAGPADTVAAEGGTAGALGMSRETRSELPPPPRRNYAEIAQLLADARGAAYMDEILAQRGGNVAHWIDRRDDPVRVWVQPKSSVRDWWPDFPARTRDAFYTWAASGIPMRFLFIDDSAAAEVRVRWVDRFPQAAGKTYWVRDQNWWIVEADVELAVHRPDGRGYDGTNIRTIALHEVGHVIGLDHTGNAESIMSARVHVTNLSAADLRTASLVYKLPPGPVGPPAN